MENELLKDLMWGADAFKQEKAIKILSSMEDLNLEILLQPSLGKGCWENVAKVLYIVGYPRVMEVIDGLFEWLQDMNWPGVDIVIEILKLIPKEIFIENLEKCVKKAINEKDEEWIYSLAQLIELFNLHEKDFTASEIYKLLIKSRN